VCEVSEFYTLRCIDNTTKVTVVTNRDIHVGATEYRFQLSVSV